MTLGEMAGLSYHTAEMGKVRHQHFPTRLMCAVLQSYENFNLHGSWDYFI